MNCTEKKMMNKIIMLMIILCSGCSTMNLERATQIAQKSYQIGCVDKGTGNPVDSYNCYMASKRFEKELRNAWRQ